MKNELKKIALIGQPNVGKSSLFNRIAKQRIAIVSDLAGTTRDVKKQEIDIFDKPSLMIDTGGIEKTKHTIFSKVKDNAIETAKEADIILFMVDGKRLPDDKDKELFYELQRLGKDLALVVNKIDNDKEKERLWEFFEFGISDENLFGISVSHNRGTKDLFQWIYNKLPLNLEPKLSKEELEKLEKLDESDDIEDLDLSQEEDTDEHNINVAIIGKVNVGKSSTLNAIIGKNRSVVSEIAGTTVDPVDESFEYKDKTITFVDTAGLRRRGKIDGIEKYALMRTKSMLEKANIALVVLDATEKFADLDEKIAGLVDEYGLGAIIVLNKWDENMDTFEKLQEEIRRRFRFLEYAPIVAISAKTGRSVGRLKDKILEIYENYIRRVPTSRLNEVIQHAIIKHALPSPNGAYLRIYFATQFSTKPAKVALIMNKPNLLHFSYKRYIVNTLRDNFNFEGTPIHVIARGKKDKFSDFEDAQERS